MYIALKFKAKVRVWKQKNPTHEEQDFCIYVVVIAIILR